MFTYIKTGLVPKFPTLIVSGFIEIAAVNSFFSGLILSTISEKNKQDFEERLQLADMKFKELCEDKGMEKLNEYRKYGIQ